MRDSDDAAPTRSLAGKVDVRAETGSNIVKYVFQNPNDTPITIRLRQFLPEATDESDITFTSEYHGDAWSFDGESLEFYLDLDPGQTVRTAYATADVDLQALQTRISESTVTIHDESGDEIERVTGLRSNVIAATDEAIPDTAKTTGAELYTLGADSVAGEFEPATTEPGDRTAIDADDEQNNGERQQTDSEDTEKGDGGTGKSQDDEQMTVGDDPGSDDDPESVELTGESEFEWVDIDRPDSDAESDREDETTGETAETGGASETSRDQN